MSLWTSIPTYIILSIGESPLFAVIRPLFLSQSKVCRKSTIYNIAEAHHIVCYVDARTGALGKNMKIFIVYCHPSEDSFTRHIRDSFIKGIIDSGNEYILSDLYKMNFNSDISERQYLRDANYNDELPVEEDIISEHEKINACDAIAFIYPVFWTEAPAKLVGWFDRVWSYGFAYGNKKMKMLEKGIILCSAGNPVERLEQFGLLSSMKRVMFGDRLFGRIK